MVDLPEPEDTEMNMTPMIDIVFQLIIFFLLTLKFKTVDERIDSSLPKDRGLAATPEKPKEFEKIKVKLFRKEKGTPAAFTRIRIDNTNTIDLPAGDFGEDVDTEYARLALEDAKFGQVKAVVTGKFEALGGDARKDEITGEIAAMRPDGGAVPHGHIMRVLDLLVEVGVGKIVFEGAPPPLMGGEGGFMTGNPGG